MKLKSIDQFLLILSFFLGSISIFMLSRKDVVSVEKKPIASILSETNIVKKKLTLFEAWLDADSGDFVHDNDQVFTHHNSSAVIKFYDGKTIKLSENSLIKIKKENNQEEVYLDKGALEAELNSLTSNKTFNITIGDKKIELKGNNSLVQLENFNQSPVINSIGGMVEIALKTNSGEKKIVLQEDETFNLKTLTLSKFIIKAKSPKNNAVIFSEGKGDNHINLKIEWDKFTIDNGFEYFIELSESRDFSISKEYLINDELQSFSLNYELLMNPRVIFWRFGKRNIETKEFELGSTKKVTLVPEIKVTLNSLNTKEYHLTDKKLKVSVEITDPLKTFHPQYEMQVLNEYEEILQTSKISHSSFDVEFNKLGIYFVKVRPLIEGSQTENWSEKLKFEFIKAKPPIIELQNAKTENVFIYKKDFETQWRKYISWKTLEGEGSFKILVYQNGEAKEFITNQNFFDIPLENAGIVNYSVVGIDQNAKSGNVVEGKIKVLFAKPMATKPERGAVVLIDEPKQDVSFKWDHRDLVSNEKYIFELSNTEVFNNILNSKETSIRKVNIQVQEVGNYFWRVKIITPKGIEYSEPVSVEIKPSPVINAPEIQDEIKVKLKIKDLESRIKSPRFNVFVLFFNTFFRQIISQEEFVFNAEWDLPENVKAKKYHVEVYEDREMKKLVFKESFFKPRANIEKVKPGTYFWRLAYEDGWGRVSEFSKLSTLIFDLDEEKIKQLTKDEEEMIQVFPKHNHRFEDFAKMEFQFDSINRNNKSPKVTFFKISRDLSFKDLEIERMITDKKIVLSCSDINNKSGGFYWRVTKENSKGDLIESKRRFFEINCKTPTNVSHTDESILKNVKKPLNNPQVLSNTELVPNSVYSPSLIFSYKPFLGSFESKGNGYKASADGVGAIAIGIEYRFQDYVLMSDGFHGKAFNDQNINSLQLGILKKINFLNFFEASFGASYEKMFYFEEINSSIKQKNYSFYGVLISKSFDLKPIEVLFSGKIGNGYSGKVSLNYHFTKYGLGVYLEKIMIDEKSIESDFTKMGSVLSFYY